MHSIVVHNAILIHALYIHIHASIHTLVHSTIHDILYTHSPCMYFVIFIQVVLHTHVRTDTLILIHKNVRKYYVGKIGIVSIKNKVLNKIRQKYIIRSKKSKQHLLC